MAVAAPRPLAADLMTETPPARWPSLPTNLISLFNPFAQSNNADPPPNNNSHNNSHNNNNGSSHHDDPAEADLESQHPTESTSKRPTLAGVQLDNSAPSSPNWSSASIMFAEPETRSTSEEFSREGSISGARRLRKSTRPKTRYSICHPVPESKVKQKLHRQPRSLLQLHILQPNARPLPALEVIPSANFSVRLTRAVTKVFPAKHGFCANDLVVLKAENYGSQDGGAQARDVIGLICKSSREEQKAGSGKMLIHMATGQQWEAYSTPHGTYECCTTDEHGLKQMVRWVPKKNKDGKGVSSDGTRKFNFSTISPNSRRHPIIATLQKTGLDINDTYKMPEPLAATPLSTPKMNATIPGDALDEESGAKDECVTDDATRHFIALTAIWVAMREGWSPSIKHDDKRDPLLSEPPNSPARSMTSPVVSPPASPGPYASLEKRASIMSFGSGIVRRASVLSRSNRSTASVREESDAESPAPSRSASINLGPSGRSRADSSATVLVHRAASNRRKKTEAMTSFRPDHVCENDLHETSREDLARDYATPDSKSARPTAERAKKSRPSLLARNSSSRPATNGASFNSYVSEGDGDAYPSKRHSRSITPEDKPGHRMSGTTSGTTSSTRPQSHQRQSSHPMPEFNAKNKMKKRRGWRRLLCGASKMD